MKKAKSLKTQQNRTVLEQEAVQNSCIEIYQNIYKLTEKYTNDEKLTEDEEYIYQDIGLLDKETISSYIYSKLVNLGIHINLHIYINNIIYIGSEVYYYDTGHPWLVYWCIHPLILLDDENFNIKSPKLRSFILRFLSYCQSPKGGFCGGHHQLPHLASTYAAILSIIEIGTIEAYESINRKLMYKFLKELRNPIKKGSFHMHENGEEDMRGVYIAVILADLLNLDKKVLLEGVGDHIASCQTYEGGIASEPFGEAHGGYSFCGFAALCCLQETHKINIERLIYWAVNRQMAIEGGFNGRTNKVVDNCYSFWQGSLFRLFNIATGNKCHIEGKMYDFYYIYIICMLYIGCIINCNYNNIVLSAVNPKAIIKGDWLTNLANTLIYIILRMD